MQTMNKVIVESGDYAQTTRNGKKINGTVVSLDVYLKLRGVLDPPGPMFGIVHAIWGNGGGWMHGADIVDVKVYDEENHCWLQATEARYHNRAVGR